MYICCTPPLKRNAFSIPLAYLLTLIEIINISLKCNILVCAASQFVQRCCRKEIINWWHDFTLMDLTHTRSHSSHWYTILADMAIFAHFSFSHFSKQTLSNYIRRYHCLEGVSPRLANIFTSRLRHGYTEGKVGTFWSSNRKTNVVDYCTCFILLFCFVSS